MKSKHDTTSKQWVYRRTEYTDRERQTILGAVMKIGVKTLFRKHVYKYGDSIYRQVKGVPTGFEITGKAAKVRMIGAMRKLKAILRKSGISWEVMFIYVDDFRVVMRSLKRGTRYCKRCQTFHFSLDQFRADKEAQETDEARTARLVGEILNSLEKDLQFTTETPRDFNTNKLPTLL